jgi:hypothetical protein
MQREEEQENRDWAENKLGLVQLGDKLLASRLVTLARSLAHAPDESGASLLRQRQSRAGPHSGRAYRCYLTWSRTRAVPIVLVVQDTTYLNYQGNRYQDYRPNWQYDGGRSGNNWNQRR